MSFLSQMIVSFVKFSWRNFGLLALANWGRAENFSSDC